MLLIASHLLLIPAAFSAEKWEVASHSGANQADFGALVIEYLRISLPSGLIGRDGGLISLFLDSLNFLSILFKSEIKYSRLRRNLGDLGCARLCAFIHEGAELQFSFREDETCLFLV